MVIIKKNKSKLKKITSFRPQIRSRHPSHSWLRHNIGLLSFRAIVRLGSTIDLNEVFRKRTPEQRSRIIECNTVQAIKTSSSKLLMKEAFAKSDVKTAIWWKSSNLPEKKEYPIIVKPLYGSRGEGIKLINNDKELTDWSKGKTLTNYIFEKYYNYNREYRLHVTKDGYFYACRKMLKSNTPKDKRHIRNDSTCIWILEENSQFDKPSNWDIIVQECVKALKAVGLDVGAIDLRVQSAKNEKRETRKNPDFIVIETNSAASHGNITREKYLVEVPKILKSKYQLKNQL